MIVVTGMHRSGTSSIAMILEALGLPFGDPEAFYGADEWNERGYYERRDVIDLNSRLVTGSPRTRGTLAAALSQVRYLMLPGDAAIARRARRLREEIVELAHELEGLAVKDPRFCLTHRAWAEHVTATVVCLRHPAAVARSLERRQRVPAALAYRFWDHHARGLLQLDPARAHHVSFDVLDDEELALQELMGLVGFLGLDLEPSEVVRRFHARFEPSLRHFSPDDGTLPARTRQLWDALLDRRSRDPDR